MSSTVTEVTILTIGSTTPDVLSTTVSVIVIVLLLVLIVQKELVRAFGGPQSREWMQALNIAIVPLLLAFGVIILVRFIELTGFRLP